MKELLYKLWFRDPAERPLYINDVAVRIRAGLLLFVPIFLSYTLYDAVFGSHWIVQSGTAVDTYDTDFDDHIIYSVHAIRRTYDYTIQTWVLLYTLFDMLSGMTVFTSRFSPTILLASLLARNKAPVWKPLTPKRFAWSLGALFIAVCLVFFNPDTFAHWVNLIAHKELLPTTRQYLPYWIPLTLVWICFGFMWMETVLGFCVGCQIHALLVKLGILKEACAECNDIFSPQAREARQKYHENK